MDRPNRLSIAEENSDSYEELSDVDHGRKPGKNFGIQVNIPKEEVKADPGSNYVDDKSIKDNTTDKVDNVNLVNKVPKDKVIKDIKVKLKRISKQAITGSLTPEDLGLDSVSNSERERIKNARLYEHKFAKTSDDGKSKSPKAKVPLQKFSEFLSKNTGYYSHSPVPMIKQDGRSFSPILRRQRSYSKFESLEVIQLNDSFASSRDIEYVALTGKIINFEG